MRKLHSFHMQQIYLTSVCPISNFYMFFEGRQVFVADLHYLIVFNALVRRHSLEAVFLQATGPRELEDQ